MYYCRLEFFVCLTSRYFSSIFVGRDNFVCSLEVLFGLFSFQITFLFLPFF